ncbi:hypothetical protein SDC9_152228 [bioreactor metagenome]|uniref:Uncharacterized protein n=1 Tax=bioreactor metagenome TaxID=1076179 RepID=A0A645EUV4_9ZZZZ
MRALFQCRSSGHCGADAIFSGLIACCRHHAVFSAAYADRFPAQFGMVVLLHGGVESVHIDVDDFAVRMHFTKLG